MKSTEGYPQRVTEILERAKGWLPGAVADDKARPF